MKMSPKLLLLLLLLPLSGCDKNDPQTLTFLRPRDVLVAFGDSLTFGTGAEPVLSYPAQLSRLLGRRVINAGVVGETSAQGAQRLPSVLDEQEPELVILCHGGNDLLQRLDRQALRTNLQRMFEAANQRGISVIMIAAPQPGLSLKDAELYRDLATELNIPLLEGTLGQLLKDPQYRSDTVHLNARGYRKLAEAVSDLLFDHGAL